MFLLLYQLTRVDVDEGPLNGLLSSSVSRCVLKMSSYCADLWYFS